MLMTTIERRLRRDGLRMRAEYLGHLRAWEAVIMGPEGPDGSSGRVGRGRTLEAAVKDALRQIEEHGLE